MDISPLLLGDVCLRAMHGLHVFPKRTGVCVALCAARYLANIWFLPRQKKTLKLDSIPRGTPEELLGTQLVLLLYVFTVNLLSNLWSLQ